MTMRELMQEFAIETETRREAQDRDLVLAWHMAAMSRMKTIPALQTLLARRDRRQSSQQQRGALQMLSEQYGIPLRKAPKGKRRVLN